MNRGVELSGDVIDGAAVADHRAGARRHRRADGGPRRGPLRLARGCAAGRAARAGADSSREPATSAQERAGRGAAARGPAVRSAGGDRRGERRARPRGRDCADRRAGKHRATAGRGGDRGRREAPAAGLHRPARPPAHAGAGAQGRHRDRNARRCGRRLLRRDRNGQHRPRRRSAGALRGLIAQAREQARIPVGFIGALSVGLPRRAADRDGAAARGGCARLQRRRQAGRVGRVAAPRAPVPAPVRRRDLACTRRTRRSRGPASCTKGRSRPSLASPGSLRSPERRWSRATA